MKIDIFFGNPLLREICVGWLDGLNQIGVNAVGVSPDHYRLMHRQPDVVLVVWPYSFSIEHFEYYRHARKVMVTTDDPFEIDHTEILARNYDVVVTHEPTTVALYPRSVHLPFAFSRFLQLAPLSPESEKEYDVCFFGGLYPPRREMLTAVTERGFHCATSLGRSRRVPVEKYYELAKISRINLNFHRHAAQQDYDHCANARQIGTTSLNSRFYQLGGLGCFQLIYANRPTPAGVSSGQVFDGPSSLVDAIEWFLERPDLREKYARSLQQKVLNEHCYEHRARQLLVYLEGCQSPPKILVDLEATAYAQEVLRPYFDDFSSWVGPLRR